MFPVTGFLPNFSTSLIAFKWKNCGKSDLCVPVTPSTSYTANTTVSSTTQIVFTDLQLLRGGWKFGLQSLHLSGWFKYMYRQSYECWMMGTYRTHWMVRTKHGCLFKLTCHSLTLECVDEISWGFYSNALHFANISLNTENSFSTQHWTYLYPAEVVTIPAKTLWAPNTPGKMGNIHKKKNTCQRTKSAQQQRCCKNKP